MTRGVVATPAPISTLDASSTPLDGTELVVIVKNGSTLRTTVAAIWQRAAGATGSRPTLEASNAGYLFYDTTLGLPVWWDGAAWTDANGNVT